MRPRDIRGGGDGSTFGSLGSAAARSSAEDGPPCSAAGESCIKYLGGPLRSYTGKAMKSTMLEVIIRPPITTLEEDIRATGMLEELDLDSIDKVLARVEKKEAVADKENADEKENVGVRKSVATETSSMSDSRSSSTGSANITSSQSPESLNKVLGMEFENVGGLDAQLDDIARRVLASCANPQAAKRLGVSHVRGILLSGPPGKI